MITEERNYEVIINDITFSKVDEDGNVLEDEDGNVIVYEAPHYDVSWICDAFNELDNEELGKMLLPVKEEQNA